VPKDNPVDLRVLELQGRDLAGVGAIPLVEDVLSRDLDFRTEGGLGQEEIEGRGRNNNLYAGLLGLE
jgi:hypothetical protein